MRCRVCSISSTLLGPQSLFAQHRVLLSFKVYWFPSMTTARALVSSTIICPWKTEMVSCFSLYSICRSHYSQSDLLKTENVFSGFPRLLNLMGNWVIIDPHSVPFAGAPLSLEDYADLPLLLFVSWGRESWRKPHKSWETPPNTGHRGGFNSQKLPPSLLQFVSCGSDFLLVSVEVSALAKEILCIHISVQPEGW